MSSNIESPRKIVVDEAIISRDVESLGSSEKTNSQANENAIACCLATVAGTGVLSIIGGLITYVVFCIIALCSVSFRTMKNHCEESNMWVWLLVSIIYNATSVSSNASSKNDNPCVMIISFIISLGLLGWGSYEMWGVSCANNLSKYLVYQMTFSTLIISYSLIGSFIIGGVIVYFKKK